RLRLLLAALPAVLATVFLALSIADVTLAGVVDVATPAARSDADGMPPAVRVRRLAVLDAQQGIAEAERDRSWLTVADRPLSVPGADGADGRHHGGRAAGEGLRHAPVEAGVAPLAGRDPALLDLEAEVGGDREQRVAGHAGQQGAGERGGQEAHAVAGTVDEEDVH